MAASARHLILASGSPRRSRLLRQAGVHFEVMVPNVDETANPKEQAIPMVQRLAKAKATIVASSAPEALVLGCDTVVVIDGQALGKPDNETVALEMLSKLSARAHHVATAYCFAQASDVVVREVEITEVTMRRIEREAAEAYVATGESFDKAGAYAIQGEGGTFVDHISGSFTNVMGLPVDRILDHLERLMPGSLAETS